MILVTGASGNIGSAVAKLLADAGRAPRRLVRDAGRAPALEGSPALVGNYGDDVSLAAAMRSVETVFLTSASGPPLRRAALHGNVIDAARSSGVRRLVYLSFQGASATSPFPYSADHLLTEAHLKQSGLDYTILRDSFYMDLIPDLADDEGVVRDPSGGGGGVAWVAREDVARSVAAVLVDDRHIGQTYDITGPEALGLEEAVKRLSAATGGRLRYVRESVDDGRAWRGAGGAPEWQVDLWIGSYLAMASGELAPVSTCVRELTGREPLTLDAWAGAGSRVVR